MRSELEQATGTAIIRLMRGVLYRETHEVEWATLLRHPGPVRDHFATIGVDVVVDEHEGYAYLRSREEDEQPLPRLITRRTLSYPVSLLLVLLRKRLVEHEASTHEPRLILTKNQIADLVGLFLADTSDQARQLDQVDTTIRKVIDLGFLRSLRGQPDTYEVRRVLKAYVDGQALADFAAVLQTYRDGPDPSSTEGTADEGGSDA